jgi:hypothetical protein
VATHHSDHLLQPAVDKVADVDPHMVDLVAAQVVRTGDKHKVLLVNQHWEHHQTEQTSPHSEQTAVSHTRTDKPVTPSRLEVAAVAARQLLVVMQLSLAQIVQPALAETVAKVLQIRGPQEHLLFTEAVAADRLVLCKALAEQTAVRQVAPTPRAAQASTQLMKQALAVAVDIAKAAVAPVTVVPEL